MTQNHRCRDLNKRHSFVPVLEAGCPRPRHPKADPVSGERPPPNSLMAILSLCFQVAGRGGGREREIISRASSYKGTGPIHEGSILTT